MIESHERVIQELTEEYEAKLQEDLEDNTDGCVLEVFT